MRRFYIRRKDLSAFPFQFTVDRQGAWQRLEKGDTYTYAILPPKDNFQLLHVHILEDFIREAEVRWDLPRAEMIRIAAKSLEAWLSDEAIPEDHFNGKDMLKVDQAWFPQGPNGEPRLAADPYDFEVITDEPWSTDALWSRDVPADQSANAQ